MKEKGWFLWSPSYAKEIIVDGVVLYGQDQTSSQPGIPDEVEIKEITINGQDVSEWLVTHLVETAGFQEEILKGEGHEI